MKKTQMIHSPRTFKFGLGLLLAAGLASMPVLIGASERADKKSNAEVAAKARAAEEKSNQKLAAAGKLASEKPTSESIIRRLASAKSESKTKGKSSGTSAEGLAKESIAKAESEAKKLASKLSPTQKKKLLALLNDAKSSQLTEIDGIGRSRSSAIEKARPIKSLEDLRKVKGVGLKTLAEVIDHGKSLSPKSGAKAKTSPSKSTTKGKKNSTAKTEA